MVTTGEQLPYQGQILVSNSPVSNSPVSNSPYPVDNGGIVIYGVLFVFMTIILTYINTLVTACLDFPRYLINFILSL